MAVRRAPIEYGVFAMRFMRSLTIINIIPSNRRATKWQSHLTVRLRAHIVLWALTLDSIKWYVRTAKWSRFWIIIFRDDNTNEIY